MIPTDTFMEASSLMIGGCDCIRAFPGQTVIIGKIGIAPFRCYPSVSSHDNTFAVSDKYRRFNHDGVTIGHLRKSTSSCQSTGSTNAINTHCPHIYQTNILLTDRALTIGKKHFFGTVHPFPGQTMIGTGQIYSTCHSLFSIIIVSDLTVIEKRQADISIGRRCSHFQGSVNRIKHRRTGLLCLSRNEKACCQQA